MPQKPKTSKRENANQIAFRVVQESVRDRDEHKLSPQKTVVKAPVKKS